MPSIYTQRLTILLTPEQMEFVEEQAGHWQKGTWVRDMIIADMERAELAKAEAPKPVKKMVRKRPKL